MVKKVKIDKPKSERPDRHSAGKPSHGDIKGGHGKYNWGDSGDDMADVKVDKGDPNYESDEGKPKETTEPVEAKTVETTEDKKE